jgi:DNA polymerase-3 subunit delta'
MNHNAANALLKLLEEPPAGTILFLISHQPGLLLPTLRSRCQQLRMALPSTATAKLWLEGQGYTGNAAASRRCMRTSSVPAR